jgi:hypothetical protein
MKTAWMGLSSMFLFWPLLAGAVMVLFMPRVAEASRKLATSKPGIMFVRGLVGTLFLPVVAVILIVSIIGFPFGLSLLVSYPLMLMVGMGLGGLMVGVKVGELLGYKRWNKASCMAALLAGITLLSILMFIPILGALCAAVSAPP